MKIVFVGPSLPDASALVSTDLEFRPPAAQGDVMRALADGATSIGLIDGNFGSVAPVWHKELLFALSKNITVFGAASMGALRAAECSAFGMIGIGRIFEDYASGLRVDDADVALLFGPAELGYPPLTIPLVNAQATIDTLFSRRMLEEAMCQRLRDAARALFFKRRSWKRIAELAGIELAKLQPMIDICWTDQKRQDAIALLEAMTGSRKSSPSDPWQFNATPLFRKMYL